MAPLRAALTALGLLIAMLGATLAARAAPAPPLPSPPAETPAAQAIGAGEELAQGSTIPELTERPALALAGKPLKRVEVVVSGNRWTTKPVIKSVRIGEPLSLEVGRRAMREVLATGQFAGASVETFAEDDGAVLRLYALPRRRVATIQLRGGALDTEGTLEAAEINDGGEITPPLLEQISAKIQRYYALHGFPSAEVDVYPTDTDNPSQVVLSIDIKPGTPRTITQRIFVIEPRADKEVGNLKASYRLTTGDRLDESALHDADRELTEELRKHGFLRAEISHAVRNVGPFGYLYIYVEAGPRIVPAFDGNRAFDADQLNEALNLEKSPDGRVTELVERLRVFYVNRGFFDVEIAPTEQGAADDPVHPVLFSIREHPQVRVVRRVFPCLGDEISPDVMGAEIEAVLREELPGSELFSPGDPRTISRLFGQIVGGRAALVDVNPLVTYSAESYDRALKHLRDLVHSKGYLNAVVGPVSVLRATCSKRSLAGQCIPERPKIEPKAACRKDSLGLPVPEPPTLDVFMCRPDPARNIECSRELTLRIPINLGPQTTLYDLAFEGNRARTEAELAKLAELPLGSPLSNVEVDAAQGRILASYRRDGYAYAEVRSVIEPSPDRTHARVRFFVTERNQVTVAGFVVKGATRTDKAVILKRLALRRGRPYGQDLVRASEERLAALGVFSSVSVGLEDAEVPQRSKRVVITVVEQTSQYLEPRVGFSSGEGARFAIEYGHRNIGGLAIALTLRIQLSYLFEFLILDPEVRSNRPSRILDNLERRNSASLTFPEIGLGPLVSLSLEGIDLHHIQRDFRLTKDAFVPTLTYRPFRQITTQFSLSAERNDFTIFNTNAISQTDPQLRVPEGTTLAVAQRASFTWDFRDNPFNAQRGGLVSTSVEHVDAFPIDIDESNNQAKDVSHFLRLTGKVSAYIKLPRGLVLALSVGAGYNLQLTSGSKTYPDRLFYLGGADSLRSFLSEQVIPQDFIDKLRKGEITEIPIRGGDLSVNPRIELRVPITDVVQIGIFLDAGNLWAEPANVNPLELRYGVGAGLRFMTPIGPVALDYGLNPLRYIDRGIGEDTGAFHFSIGLF
jgi:outer membrane protein insertion porin family